MDSPYGWNLILAYIVAPLHEAWIMAGYGVRLDEYTNLTLDLERQYLFVRHEQDTSELHVFLLDIFIDLQQFEVET